MKLRGGFEAGVGSFVLERGEGDPVVCLHGVPVSSFLYRKVVPELASRGLRGVAFDFPGLGLAERPEGFDYSWSGLARWTGAAIDALGIERCHLVVHDLGGPVGFEWAIRNPERVLSLTALNTWVSAASFHRPWPMHPFSIRGVGELWLRGMVAPAFAELFYLETVADRAAVPRAEVYAHHALLKRGRRRAGVPRRSCAASSSPRPRNTSSSKASPPRPTRLRSSGARRTG